MESRKRPVVSVDNRTRTVLLVCGWCGPLTVVVAFAGWLVSGVLPLPVGPGSPVAEIAQFYNNGARVPMGLALSAIGVSLVIPMIGAVSHLLREQGNQPLLSQLQTIAGAVTAVLLVVPMLIMASAGYRPDRLPELTVMLHDLSWLLFITPVGPFVIQNLIIATAVLSSESSPFPRWLGYLNLWVGFTFTFDVVAFAFHTGPFAWNGFVIFWLALSTYALWLFATGLTIRFATLKGCATNAVDLDAENLDEHVVGEAAR